MAFDTTHDIVPDSPTNTFATLNPLGEGLSGTLSDGNLKNVMGNAHNSLRGNFYISSGKWYWEVYVVSVTNSLVIGLSSIDEVIGTAFGPAKTIGFYSYDGKIYYNSTSANYDFSYGATDIIGVYLNLDDNPNQLSFYKNGSVLNSGTTIDLSNATYNLGTLKFTPRFDDGTGTGGGATFYVNHGQDSSFGGNKTIGSANATDSGGIGDFYYKPVTSGTYSSSDESNVVSNFKALCTANIQSDLAIDPALDDLPEDYCKTVIWTGSGNYQRTITVGTFLPDLIWIKNRDADISHTIYDSLRGYGDNKILHSDNTNSESAGGTSGFIAPTTSTNISNNSFTFDGTSSTESDLYYTDRTGDKFCAWCWKAGGAPSADGVAMVDGAATTTTALKEAASASITPTRMSVNTTAGFSIVRYTGNGQKTATVPHGLSGNLDFIITKDINSGSDFWHVDHISLPSNANLFPNNNWAKYSDSADGWVMGTKQDDVIAFGSGSGNSGTNVAAVNENNIDVICYCWKAVAGYSAFGSYTGNGSADGPFVYTGFKPAWVMFKETTATNSWIIFDSARDFYNKSDSSYLYPDLSLNEQTGVSGNAAGIDILSNGFKCKTSNTELNATNQTYIYVAFAEMPFKYAATNAR